MRLLIDLQACQGPSATRGIGYYSLALTRALAQHRGTHEVVVLLDGAQPAEEVLRLRERLAPLGRNDVVLFSAPPPALRVHARPDTEAAREAAITALNPDAVLVTSIFELSLHAPMSVNEWCSDVPTAAVLYDLIPLTDLSTHKAEPLLRAAYMRGLERLRRTDLLLSISDFSRTEGQRLLDRCPPVTTVHGAAPELAAPRRPRHAPDAGFVLTVGLHEPRKDIATAVLGWAGVPGHVRGGRPFVIAGNWPEKQQQLLRWRAESAGLSREELLFAGSLDDGELAWLYDHADLFVFPSLSEGLGLPPLEAARRGTPVLLARSSSLIELLDDDRAYFPPGNVAAATALMLQVMTDDGVREELIASGRRADQRFTWEHTAGRAWQALLALPTRSRRTLTPPVVHDLGGDWSALETRLVEDPGVVVLPQLDDDAPDLSTLLAPAVGVIVRSRKQAAVALERGISTAPVHVVPEGASVTPAAVACWAGDPSTHWVEALTPHALDDEVNDAMLRRPRWANRPRGAVLASDVTIYRTTPFLSGIQRATRRLHEVLRELALPAGGAVLPVSFGDCPPGMPHPAIASDPVLAAMPVLPGDADWVLCLDLDDRLPKARAELQAARATGVGVVTNVFDLLPWAHPEWWPPGSAAASFLPWLKAALHVSDVVLVNSVETAREIERFIATEGLRRHDRFEVHLLRLGADLQADPEQPPIERAADHFLMVGTVEPRKGHAGVLDAFEALWREGRVTRLTVLGRAGWMVDDVIERMKALAEGPFPFRWLMHATDRELDEFYSTCTAVVVASEGEGFGLPIVEAAVRGCPVIVHDIPVLRELAGSNATYFGGERRLLSVLRQVLDSGAAVPSLERVHTWGEVGQRLLDVLGGQVQPLATWVPRAGWCWT